MHDINKNDDLHYKPKHRKAYKFGKYSLPIAFLRDINEGYLSLKNANLKQSNFAIELKNFEKDTKTLEKKVFFLNNLGLLFSAREKVLNSFKGRLFPIKKLDKIPTSQPTTEPTAEPKPEVATETTEATPTKHKKSKLKLKH